MAKMNRRSAIRATGLTLLIRADHQSVNLKPNSSAIQCIPSSVLINVRHLRYLMMELINGSPLVDTLTATDRSSRVSGLADRAHTVCANERSDLEWPRPSLAELGVTEAFEPSIRPKKCHRLPPNGC